jgi:hypothetical protein
MAELVGELKSIMEARRRTLSDDELVELSMDFLKKG